MEFDMFESDSKPVNEVIGDLIGNALEKSIRSEGRKRSGGMRGSEIASECSVRNVGRLNQTSTGGISGYFLLAAEAGKAAESVMVDQLVKDNEIDVKCWNEFIPYIHELDLTYSGKLDLLIYIKGIGYVVVDLKTAQRLNDEKRVDLEVVKELLEQGLDKETFLKKAAKSKIGVRKSPVKWQAYEDQVVGYATLLDVNYGMVYAVSRSKETFHENVTTETRVVHISDEMKYTTIARMILAERCSDQYVIPFKPKNFKKTKQCKYCDFFSGCWNDEEHEALKGFRRLTEEETEVIYVECYEQAVGLYDKHRNTLRTIREEKVRRTKVLKTFIQSPTIPNLIEVTEKYGIRLENLTTVFEPAEIAESRKYNVELVGVPVIERIAD